MKRTVSMALALVLVLSMVLFAFPTVSADEPTQNVTLISTPEEFSKMREDVTGHYRLANDIVFTKSDFEVGGAFYNGGAGWTPIGTSSTPFSGTLDGNGYTVSGLQMTVTGSANATVYVGVFGWMTGTVKNLRVADVSFSLNGGKSVRAAGLAAYSRGLIQNVAGTGTVTAVNGSNTSSAGGIVGIQTRTASIEHAYAEVKLTVESVATYAGGIIGNNKGGIVSLCHANGEIEADARYNLFIGGIAGTNEKSSSSSGVVVDCLHTGTVDGWSESETYGGGLVGQNQGRISACATLKEPVLDGASYIYIGQAVGTTDAQTGVISTIVCPTATKKLPVVSSGSAEAVTQVGESLTVKDVEALLSNHAAWTFADGALRLTGAAFDPLTYTGDGGFATITGAGLWFDGTLDVPDTLGGVPVAAVAADAFAGHQRLTAVTVPDHLTAIGAGAFGGCQNLQTVRFYSLSQKDKFAASFAADVAITCLCKDDKHVFAGYGDAVCDGCGFTVTQAITVESAVGGKGTASCDAAMYGDALTLTATADEGYVFSYWLVNGRVFTQSELVITVNGPVVAKPMFSAIAVDPADTMVSFFTADGRLVAQMSWTDILNGGDLPTVPTRYGFINGQWDVVPDGEDLSQTEVYPTYQKDPSIVYSIAVTDDSILSKTTAAFNDRITVSAADPSGFAAWVDQTGRIVSVNPSYTFYASQDVVLTAKTTDEVAPVAYYININAKPIAVSTTGTTFRLSVVADSYADNATYTVAERGILYTAASMTEADMVIGAAGVKKKAATTAGNGQFMYSLNGVPKDASVTVRAYMTIRDAAGNVTTVYSALCDASWTD